jgi:ribosomal-protein-alanine N-acetyltransferase
VTTGPLPAPDPPLTDAAAGIGLRAWERGDAAALAGAWAVADIAGQAAVPGAGAVDDAERWIAGAPARRVAGAALDLAVVAISAPGEVRGEVGLSRLVLRAGAAERREWEVGWWVLPAHRGRGVATAAAGLLVGWATSELGVARVVARIDRGHGASEAVAGRIGLRRLGAADATRDLWGGPV